jgi:hypothetical protein
LRPNGQDSDHLVSTFFIFNFQLLIFNFDSATFPTKSLTYRRFDTIFFGSENTPPSRMLTNIHGVFLKHQIPGSARAAKIFFILAPFRRWGASLRARRHLIVNPQRDLNILLKNSTKSRVGARGPQDFCGNLWVGRPGAPTGRVFQRAAFAYPK